MAEQQLLEYGDYNSTIPGGYVPLQATDGQAPVWDAARNEYVPTDVTTGVGLAAHNADAAANPAAIAAHNVVATSVLAAHIKMATIAQTQAGVIDDAAATPAGVAAALAAHGLVRIPVKRDWSDPMLGGFNAVSDIYDVLGAAMTPISNHVDVTLIAGSYPTSDFALLRVSSTQSPDWVFGFSVIPVFGSTVLLGGVSYSS